VILRFLLVLLCLLLTPMLSHATSITITGGTALITAQTYQVNFSGLDEAGNVYRGSAFTEGYTNFGAPGQTLQYAAQMGNYGALSVNGQTISPGGNNNIPTVFYALVSSGSVQLPEFVTPGPLTLVGPFALSGSIHIEGGNLPPTSIPLNGGVGLAAVRVTAFSGTEYFANRFDAVYGTTVTPEPSSWLLFASGLGVFILWRWRRSIRLLVFIGLLFGPTLSYATSITITGGTASLHPGSMIFTSAA
jgi:PEP-CTERM motif-containing protein